MASQTLEQICCEQPTTADKTPKTTQTTSTEEVVERAQWLRAAILGANDGLLSTTSLLLGVGAAKQDRWSMALAGLAGAFAGACSMAVGEFVSVSTQRDIEEKLFLENKPTCPEYYSKSATPGKSPAVAEEHNETESALPVVLPNPHKAAAVSALAFLSGSVVPLIPAALVADHATSVIVIVVVATLALAVFGWGGAKFGGSSRPKVSAVRVVVGGWLAMAVTYALLKPFDRDHGNKY
ncbi:vacuolar iron transporter homolog 2-like [Humulus lupulus]|uniref:vacuolar iron transporter homolog 2-like n=1 Tax=Humulus lupulus TaxID=3486 RepID=UPI002B40F603|nr:vacuolar iron transporter homolog 2-like [Humulus lupulus]